MTATAQLTNSPLTYGGVTKTFHWLTALLILANLPLGLVANYWPTDTSAALSVKATMFSLHKTMGVTVFFVALARIAWALAQPKPGLLNADRKLERWLAETMHWALYASLVLVPLSGWIHHAATTGFAPIWWPFGQSLPLVPKSEAVGGFFGAWHWVFTKVLAASVVLHIAGALKHHFVDRDATLQRMLPGRTAPPVPPQHADRRPAMAALGLWAAAIALGSVLGLSGAPATAVQAPELAQAPSQWQVQQGRLGIAVQQFGSRVEGSFSDWTAQIDFDPQAEGAVSGHVDVQIAVPSLTLGSVTSDALGAEFLAAEAHPRARYEAEIRTDPDRENGYIAEGPLRVKGVEAPVRLPFTLQIDGDEARMQGETTLDRRRFDIGTQNYDDEKTVAFPVTIRVELTAIRGTGAEGSESQ